MAPQIKRIGAFVLQSMRECKERIALDALHPFQSARIAGRVGFWKWNLDTDQLIVEPEFRKLLGCRESGGGPFDWRAHIDKEDLAAVLREARECVAGHRLAFEVQHRIVDGNKNVRWFLSRGRILFDRGDRPLHIVGTAIDITDRKHEEDERARVQAKLQERRVEFDHRSRIASAGVLAGALARELKQSLSVILTNAQAGQRYLLQPNVMPDELRAILADIESEDRRISSIIGNVWNMLKPGGERFVPVDLETIVHDVLTLLRGDLVARNVQVVVAPMTGLPRIFGESIQLQQVLLNVINNACDALTGVDPRDRRLVILTEIVGGRVHISISDNGCGLGDRDRQEIFKPFMSTKLHGLGLGLSISQSIVEAHNGNIWAEDNRCSGMTIHIEFPASLDTSAKNRSARPLTQSTVGHPTGGEHA